MVSDRLTVVAVALLAVAAFLLANPLYLQEDDRGNQIVQVDETTPVEGAAQRSPSVRQAEDLSVVARYAARGYLANGSFQVARDGPPLALQLLGMDGRYVASHRAVAIYEPTVTVGANRTTLTLSRVSAEMVEDELGLTPPGGLGSNETLRRIAWIADRSDAVVAVGEFDDAWEPRMEAAVSSGELTVANGNDASTLVPLGGEVRYVADGGEAYRSTVAETNRSVRLELTPVDPETLLTETDVATIETDSLSPGTRAVVVAAIEDEGGYTRFAMADVDRDELERLRSALVRHEDQYYLLSRGHIDGFSFLPLIRLVLMVVGGVIGFVGVIVLYRARDWPR